MTQPPMEPPPPAPDYNPPYQPPTPGPSTAASLGSRAVRVAISVGLVIAVGAGVRALTDNSDDADRDADGNIASEQDVSAFAVQQGDCLDDETLAAMDMVAAEVDDVRAIPCKKPHTFEAYHVFDLEGGDDYPGTTEVEKLAEGGCFDAFLPFVGIPANKSKLALSYLYPGAGTWTELDDRSVVCLVGEPGGASSTGTLKDAKR